MGRDKMSPCRLKQIKVPGEDEERKTAPRISWLFDRVFWLEEARSWFRSGFRGLWTKGGISQQMLVAVNGDLNAVHDNPGPLPSSSTMTTILDCTQCRPLSSLL